MITHHFVDARQSISSTFAVRRRQVPPQAPGAILDAGPSSVMFAKAGIASTFRILQLVGLRRAPTGEHHRAPKLAGRLGARSGPTRCVRGRCLREMGGEAFRPKRSKFPARGGLDGAEFPGATSWRRRPYYREHLARRISVAEPAGRRPRGDGALGTFPRTATGFRYGRQRLGVDEGWCQDHGKIGKGAPRSTIRAAATRRRLRSPRARGTYVSTHKKTGRARTFARPSTTLPPPAARMPQSRRRFDLCPPSTFATSSVNNQPLKRTYARRARVILAPPLAGPLSTPDRARTGAATRFITPAQQEETRGVHVSISARRWEYRSATSGAMAGRTNERLPASRVAPRPGIG